MSRVEVLDPSTLDDFLAADIAVLILAKTTCTNCAKWSEELEAKLAEEDPFPQVRFGKLYLDKPGLIKFKKANPWITEVDVLPFNVLYAAGEQKKSYAGGGFDRLRNRLNRILGG